MRDRDLALLLDLLHQPTAPFREQRVVDFVCALLRDHGVPYFLDPIGNVVVGCASARAYRRKLRAATSEPLRLFMAHMDHPGFHGSRWLARDRLRVRWHGGAPTRGLRGARVWLADSNGERYDGRLVGARLRRDGRTIDTAEVRVKSPIAKPRPSRAGVAIGETSVRTGCGRSGWRIRDRQDGDTHASRTRQGTRFICGTADARRRSRFCRGRRTLRARLARARVAPDRLRKSRNFPHARERGHRQGAGGASRRSPHRVRSKRTQRAYARRATRTSAAPSTARHGRRRLRSDRGNGVRPHRHRDLGTARQLPQSRFRGRPRLPRPQESVAKVPSRDFCNSFARRMSALTPEISTTRVFEISARHVLVAHGVCSSTNP